MPSLQSEANLAGLLHRLMCEVFRIETVAVRQCQRGAERLRHTDPVGAMLAIAAHGQETLCALPRVCEQDGLPSRLEGGATRGLFLALRDKFVDLTGQTERSYRATLQEAHHGVDVMRIALLGANAASKLALAEFCAAWLTTRTVLLERADAELLYFMAEKGAEQRWHGERYGRIETGPPLHPWTKESGRKGASNVGQDETSGSE